MGVFFRRKMRLRALKMYNFNSLCNFVEGYEFFGARDGRQQHYRVIMQNHNEFGGNIFWHPLARDGAIFVETPSFADATKPADA
jgi:hypothetical protein